MSVGTDRDIGFDLHRPRTGNELSATGAFRTTTGRHTWRMPTRRASALSASSVPSRLPTLAYHYAVDPLDYPKEQLRRDQELYPSIKVSRGIAPPYWIPKTLKRMVKQLLRRGSA